MSASNFLKSAFLGVSIGPFEICCRANGMIDWISQIIIAVLGPDKCHTNRSAP